MKSRYWHEIDLVRFVAAFLVFCTHLGASAWYLGDTFASKIVGAPPTRGAAISPWLGFGWVGVEIFFVISGAVIAQSAVGRSPWAFVQSRALRLYPAIWLIAPFTLALVLSLGIMAPKAAFLAFFKSMLVVPFKEWIDPVYWTLAVEVLFYLLVTLWLLVRERPRLELVGMALCIWSFGYHVIKDAALFGLPQYIHLSLAIERTLLLQHGIYFAIGIFLWALGTGRPKSLPIAGLILAVSAAQVDLWAAGRDTIERLRDGGYDLAGFEWVPGLIWTACCAIVGFSILKGLNWKPRPAHIAKVIGAMTFPLYLLHQTVGGTTIRFAVQTGFGQLPAFLLALAAAVAASYFVSAKTEPYLREKIRQVLAPVAGLLERHVPSLLRAAPKPELPTFANT